jgi:aminoglycoside/choline kinase family phosphotransferase
LVIAEFDLTIGDRTQNHKSPFTNHKFDTLDPVSRPALPAPVQIYLDRTKQSSARVVPLTGDASDRRYFRVLPTEGRSFVLAVNAGPFDYATLPFVNVAGLFAAMPLPVPKILGEAADHGVLALDDLGDVTLQAHVGAAPAAAHAALYREAVGFIEVMQRRGRELQSPSYIPYGIAFDIEKLTWEMDFFIKHFLEAYRGVTFAAGDREALRTELGALVTTLANEPRVLCHRDYHSRNLMLSDGRLWIIDFQDARMGPDTYDLVSLLRDSYVDISEEIVDELLAYFLALAGRSAEAEPFRRRFDEMALQRNLKALGTFGYQTTTRTNTVYIQYIPRTLRYARQQLHKHPRFAPLLELLARYVEEFR